MILSQKIKFASVDEGQKMLIQEDLFTKSWSRFDIDSRMGEPGHTKDELLQFIQKQVKGWLLEDLENINAILIEIETLTKSYDLKLPNEIYLIKTTTKEEGGARGYTRQNYIVLNDEAIAGDREQLRYLIIHELFHVMTRANPELRQKLYQIIGFNIIDPVVYPEEIKPFRITNPDAPQTDSSIKLTIDGKAIDCMMVLYANDDYRGGSFFNYLESQFLDIKTNMLYCRDAVSDFFEQVGGNTDYIIHPEEILAENFVAVILDKKGLPDQHIVDEISGYLKANLNYID